MRASRNGTLAIACAMVVALGHVLSAHRRDEYLQAARIAVAQNRVDVEIDLTPGIDVAEGIIADVDRDANGTLSDEEKQAYVERVGSALVLELDGRPLRVEAIGSTFPELEAFRRGEGTMRLQSHAMLSDLSEGAHRLWFRNALNRDLSVYLVNALVPESDRIAITEQRRDRAQSEITIAFVVRPASGTSLPMWLLTTIAGIAGAGWLIAVSGRVSRTSRRGGPSGAAILCGSRGAHGLRVVEQGDWHGDSA